MRYHRIAGICVLASLIAACSGHNSSSLLPTTSSPGQQPAVGSTPALHEDDTASSSLTSVQGTVDGITTGRFDVSTGGSEGIVPVTTSSGTVNTDAVALKNGDYAMAVGNGGGTLAATYVALFSSNPGDIDLSGTVTGTTSYGMLLKTSSGTVPIMISSSTSGSYTVGDAATVEGRGSTAVAVLANSVSGGSGTESGGVALHVRTGDYLGTPWGSTSVSPSTASKYLDIVRTAASNGNAMHAAGLQVQIYMNPLHVESSDPLYSMVASTAFSTTCGGDRIYNVFAGNDEWLMDPGSSSLKEQYDALVSSQIAGQHVDEVFEDNAGPIEYDGAEWIPEEPCDYADSAWISGEESLEASLPVPTIFNGLSAFGSETEVAPSMGLLSNSSTIGGEVENCFGADTIPAQGSWPWVLTEQTQLEVTAKDKYFQCQSDAATEAESSYASRIYAIASFLMTYNQTYSSLWENYATPSGVHVMPESQLVPTEPLVSTPSEISSLERGTDTYVREYKACYYAGRLIGQCAMVVNEDFASHPTPSLSQTYHHTLALSGNGVLDGGSVSFDGSAPPSTMGEESAFVALP